MSRNFEMLRRLQKELEGVPATEETNNPLARNYPTFGQPGNVRLDPNGSTPEELSKLVERIFFSRGKASARVLAFAGVDDGDCCSKLITEAAVTLARMERGRVCLVDAYFHSPSLSEFLDLGHPCGLVEASQAGGPIMDFAIPLRDGKLSLLPWGSPEAGATIRLPLDRVKQWLDELSHKFGYVMVNAPPLNRFAEGIAFGQLSDGSVPVFDRSATEPAEALRQLERLNESRVRVYGPVWSYGHFRKDEADAAREMQRAIELSFVPQVRAASNV